MARKSTRLTIAAEGRDKGKTFVLIEMPADQAERWAIRAVLALAQSGAQISEDAIHAGMAGIAAMGVQALAGVRWETLEPLLDEMWGCIQYEHTAGKTPIRQDIFAGANSQIEEVATRMTLRFALWELHLGFSLPEAPPTSAFATGEKPASTTSTFLESLAGWYRRAVQR
jgi:hypothetical protein